MRLFGARQRSHIPFAFHCPIFVSTNLTNYSQSQAVDLSQMHTQRKCRPFVTVAQSSFNKSDFVTPNSKFNWRTKGANESPAHKYDVLNRNSHAYNKKKRSPSNKSYYYVYKMCVRLRAAVSVIISVNITECNYNRYVPSFAWNWPSWPFNFFLYAKKK